MRTKKTKYLILGLLCDGDLSGYEIKQIVDIRFHFFWNESYGQLYPELKNMALSGLIIAHNSPDNSSRGKILYSITEKGKTALKKWLIEPVEKESVRFELLLKMYFSKEMKTEVMNRHLTEFAELHRKQLDILQHFQKELMRVEDPASNHKDILQVIAFGLKIYGAYLEWSAEAIVYLEEREKS